MADMYALDVAYDSGVSPSHPSDPIPIVHGFSKSVDGKPFNEDPVKALAIVSGCPFYFSIFDTNTTTTLSIKEVKITIQLKSGNPNGAGPSPFVNVTSPIIDTSFSLSSTGESAGCNIKSAKWGFKGPYTVVTRGQGQPALPWKYSCTVEIQVWTDSSQTAFLKYRTDPELIVEGS